LPSNVAAHIFLALTSKVANKSSFKKVWERDFMDGLFYESKIRVPSDIEGRKNGHILRIFNQN